MEGRFELLQEVYCTKKWESLKLKQN